MSAARQPYVVGLTGGIGSGKSTVAQLFADRGVPIVDTDMIAHDLTRPGGLAIPSISEQFGTDFIEASGAMDRAKMRRHVFGDESARNKLQAILHPLIRVESERLVLSATSSSTSSYVMLVVPLLFESGRWKETTQRTLLVDCPEDEQIRRVNLRSGLDEAQVRAIMNRQMGRAERLRLADDVLDNSAIAPSKATSTAASLGQQVERLHEKYLHLAQGQS